MHTIKWPTSPDEMDLIAKIAARANEMDHRHNGAYAADRKCWMMDFSATHANGCPLKLAELYQADDFNFAHDAYGIARHIDRSTGKLTDCFLPRYAA